MARPLPARVLVWLPFVAALSGIGAYASFLSAATGLRYFEGDLAAPLLITSRTTSFVVDQAWTYLIPMAALSLGCVVAMFTSLILLVAHPKETDRLFQDGKGLP